MEEIKNEGQETKKCCGLNGKCGGKCHKIAKIVLVILIAFLLLSIGAVIGSRHAAHSNFNRKANFGSGMQGNFQQRGGRGGRQFQMMRGGQGFNNQNQIQGQGQGQIQVQVQPVKTVGTSTPAAPAK